MYILLNVSHLTLFHTSTQVIKQLKISHSSQGYSSIHSEHFSIVAAGFARTSTTRITFFLYLTSDWSYCTCAVNVSSSEGLRSMWPLITPVSLLKDYLPWWSLSQWDSQKQKDMGHLNSKTSCFFTSWFLYPET